MRTQLLTAGASSAVIDLDRGARLTSLVLAGHELLATASVSQAPIGVTDGCFAMAPYAGRVRHGRLCWRGHEYRLPVTFGPNAIHGTVYDVAWTEIGPGASRADLDGRWPFGGWVEQVVALEENCVRLQLVVGNDEREMPAWTGFHPWFRRRIGSGAPARVELDARSQYALGDDALPTGELVDPLPGPWDDCFITNANPPRIIWPARLTLELHSSHDHVVVFDQLDDVLCLEPQTGPPDAVRLERAATVAPGRPLVLDVEYRALRTDR